MRAAARFASSDDDTAMNRSQEEDPARGQNGWVRPIAGDHQNVELFLDSIAAFLVDLDHRDVVALARKRSGEVEADLAGSHHHIALVRHRVALYRWGSGGAGRIARPPRWL